MCRDEDTFLAGTTIVKRNDAYIEIKEADSL